MKIKKWEKRRKEGKNHHNKQQSLLTNAQNETNVEGVVVVVGEWPKLAIMVGL